MLRASIARLGMHGSGPLGAPGPAPVHAVATLADVTVPDGATSAQVAVALSHPVSGSDLVLTLTDDRTVIIPVGEMSGLSESYVITPGGESFVVGIVSHTGGGFTSIDISDTCVVTPGAVVEMLRVYKGSIVQSTSGSFPKTDLLTLSETTGALTEVDCEAVGGGAGGQSTPSISAWTGGTPGNVDIVTVAYPDLPDTIEVSVGAGGPGSTTTAVSGGATTISGIVVAAVSGTDILSPKDRSVGPGQGATSWQYRSSDNDGGKSNADDPELVLDGGIGSGDSRTSAIHGLDATTPFQHGSGGGSWNASTDAGRGGWPGGGGGKGTSGSAARGGAGAARFHVYALEPAT